MSEVVVVGGGLGGLSAAIHLAVAGHDVELFEAAPRLGGKAGVVELDGLALDTGPSLLTLPHVFEELFQAAGSSLQDHLELIRPQPAFRYVFPDGVLDLHEDLDASAANVRATLGARAEREYRDFLDYARRLWEAAGPPFVYGPRPAPFDALAKLPVVLRIDALRTMRQAIRGRVKTRELRWVFERFATYNGSDPSRAPATLNCIAHVELGLGGYGVRGGVHTLVSALQTLCRRTGVRIHLSTPVERLLRNKGRVVGVVAGQE